MPERDDTVRDRRTGIEWTSITWNPTVGCSLASAGCTNCYAMRMARRLEAWGAAPYQGTTRTSRGGPVWTGRVGRASAAARRKPLGISKPSLIFVNSMSDLFHPDMEPEWVDEAFEVMIQADRHVYQILTKRPEVAAAYFETRPQFRALPHVWLGVSVERADAAWRIDVLRSIPAELRFLSVEPLIGPVGRVNLDGIGWVITGGESGPGARTCEAAWVREVRDQCAAAGVPLFHKQWGKWANNPLVSEQGLGPREAAMLDPDPDAKGGASLDGELWRELPLTVRDFGALTL